jgi:hypothetical protein
LENVKENKIPKQMKTNEIYTPELIKIMCKSFGPYWNENKWGANICL